MNFAKLRLTSVQKPQFQSVSIFKFVHTCLRCSCYVTYTFFSCFEQLFLCFTQFGGGQHCFSFDKFHDTAPLQKKKKKKKRNKEKKEGRKKERMKERKKERKKTLSNLFFLLIQLHDRRFILFFRFSYRHLCCV